ncbi:ral guanine nucleotide dissociation stimulator-like protein 1-like protein [Sarcoptes scabiei]|uniref:Ral guanine nucleotide dissociation stimulator-like protein 1-like protein n=1 Tax=Sarcoptes scabiei TaxID=52283 RepID=A0A132AEZ5_SARSC|nr:ral guanine nucleotide dissociation stimulator-like protein 1-like protein [Sarcoptes scabiei]
MHVLFATYRQFCYPWQLFREICKQKPFANPKQFNFILFYWLNNYPEDFWTVCGPTSNTTPPASTLSPSPSSLSSSPSSTKTSTSAPLLDTSIESDFLADQQSPIDSFHCQDNESLYSEYSGSSFSSGNMKRDHSQQQHPPQHPNQSIYKTINKSLSINELDAKFIAQQLTVIDLENFLTLKPYNLLATIRTKTKIEIMIRNFNLLSRHVVITILQHQTPHVVTNHWIEVAQHLRKMRNFNSLKAIIAGLTNESIYRLRNVIWAKLSRTTLSTFQNLSSIVDDVNNQTMLRHTQLFVEGTSKVSNEESFGTVPYLGTFLTDITMINTRHKNYIKLESGQKLINFEKCNKQYEILMQIQLSQLVPTIPRVARIFRQWFQMNESDLPNDRDW